MQYAMTENGMGSELKNLFIEKRRQLGLGCGICCRPWQDDERTSVNDGRDCITIVLCYAVQCTIESSSQTSPFFESSQYHSSQTLGHRYSAFRPLVLLL